MKMKSCCTKCSMENNLMRRDKKKDLILDFTSLLDVVMLLLFFFILFSRFDVSNAEAAADKAKTEAAAQVALAESQAQEKIGEAEKSKNKYDDLIEENTRLQEQLEHNIEIVNQVTSQEANEIVAFNSGNNLKLILQSFGSEAGPATLIAILNKEEIGRSIVARATDTEDEKMRSISAQKLAGWITAHGIQKDSVIMCDFIFNSDLGRTSKEYGIIIKLIKDLQNEHGYEHFYCSETDIFRR